MKRAEPRGYTLIEVMVSLALLTMLICLCGTTYFATQHYVRMTAEGSQELMRALSSGERWRTDVRWATQAPVCVDNGLVIAQKDYTVRYIFKRNEVLRKVDGELDWTSILSHVASSKMVMDRSEHVSSWRWEIELIPERKGFRPHRFTFLAVPMGVSKGDGNAR